MAERLPWPEGWHAGVVPGCVPSGCLAAAGTGLLVIGVAAFAGGQRAGPWVLFVGVLAWMVAPAVWPSEGPPRQDARGLVVRMRRRAHLGFAAIVAGFSAAAFGMWRSDDRDRAVVMAGAVVVMVVFQVRARPWRFALRVMPDGVSVTDRVETFVPWQPGLSVDAYDVVIPGRFGLRNHIARLGIAAARVRHHPRPPSRMDRWGSAGYPVDLSVRPLGVDPVVLCWTLRYYAAHPEARDELRDGRALARIERGDLLDGTPDSGPPAV